MWCDDSGGGAGGYQPPITPEELLQISFGGLAGTPVDAYVATIGPCAGYTLSYPTRVEGMELIVDRLKAGAVIGGSAQCKICAICGPMAKIPSLYNSRGPVSWAWTTGCNCG